MSNKIESENSINTSIGKRLEALREAKGMSQGDLGKVFNVSNQTIHNWEYGIRQVSPENLKKYSEYFGVSLESIYNGEGFDPLTANNAFESYYGLLEILIRAEQAGIIEIQSYEWLDKDNYRTNQNDPFGSFSQWVNIHVTDSGLRECLKTYANLRSALKTGDIDDYIYTYRLEKLKKEYSHGIKDHNSLEYMSKYSSDKSGSS